MLISRAERPSSRGALFADKMAMTRPRMLRHACDATARPGHVGGYRIALMLPEKRADVQRKRAGDGLVGLESVQCAFVSQMSSLLHVVCEGDEPVRYTTCARARVR